MLDARKIHEIEQSSAAAIEVAPALTKMWGEIFRGCMVEGFTDAQAMRLVIAFITSSARAAREEE